MDKSNVEIKLGTKVHYETDEHVILNMIAVKHEKTDLFDMWLCIAPCCYSTTGECAIHQCFTEDLKIGWTSRVRTEDKVLDEMIPKIKKEGYDQGQRDMQEFVENKCRELGIDFIPIFTAKPAD